MLAKARRKAKNGSCLGVVIIIADFGAMLNSFRQQELIQADRTVPSPVSHQRLERNLLYKKRIGKYTPPGCAKKRSAKTDWSSYRALVCSI